jgi:hypothetical protein
MGRFDLALEERQGLDHAQQGPSRHLEFSSGANFKMGNRLVVENDIKRSLGSFLNPPCYASMTHVRQQNFAPSRSGMGLFVSGPFCGAASAT